MRTRSELGKSRVREEKAFTGVQNGKMEGKERDERVKADERTPVCQSEAE